MLVEDEVEAVESVKQTPEKPKQVRLSCLFFTNVSYTFLPMFPTLATRRNTLLADLPPS